MCELHGDEMRREYEPLGPKLWLIEDGGAKAWYVALRAHQALEMHEVSLESEALTHPGEATEVTLLAPADRLTLAQDTDPEDWPAHWLREEREGVLRVTATHAEWAHHYGEVAIPRGGAVQVGSSEW